MAKSTTAPMTETPMDVASDLFRCPITGLPLRALREDERQQINHRIASQQLQHADGSPVSRQLSMGLISQDGGHAYMVEDGIFVLLPALAIPLQRDLRKDSSSLWHEDTRMVQAFYDETGWTSDGRGFFDARQWEDMRPVAQQYIHSCHARVGQRLPQRGEYLLDVASGPVQYAEYLEYSRGFRKRLCVDISWRALLEARKKLGAHGVYVLGDITSLPLRDGVVDAAVSLHTIYHVPEERQALAFRELHRVVKLGGVAVVVYNWRSRAVKVALAPAKAVTAPWRFARKTLRRLRDRKAGHAPGGKAEKRLYFHAFPYRWFVEQPWEFPYDISVWRSVSVPMLRTYVHDPLLGRWLLSWLYRLEERYPRALGRHGAYPLIEIRKPNSRDVRKAA